MVKKHSRKTSRKTSKRKQSRKTSRYQKGGSIKIYKLKNINSFDDDDYDYQRGGKSKK